MPKKSARQTQSKAQERIDRTEAYANKVRSEFADAVNSILALNKKIPELKQGVMYSFDGAGKSMRREVDDVLRQLHSVSVASIRSGITQEWNIANKEVDELIASALGRKSLSNPKLSGWFERNEQAMTAFTKRTENGFNLSNSIWKDTLQLREEMEVAMTVAIGEGQSASQISRKVRQYLNDPDLMFRRFRYKDDDGEWQTKWKKKVMDDNGKYHFIDYDRDSYKTGAGVYKSSYRNAMRVARTETNMAYRRADNDRWSRLDFVLGQHIELSRSHPKEDICDDLQGDYPKDFLFEGWHPQCFCICTPILASEEDMEKRMDAVVNGEEYEPSYKPITTYPEGFQKFVEDNAKGISDSLKVGTAPYFVANNEEVVRRILNGERLTDDKAQGKQGAGEGEDLSMFSKEQQQNLKDLERALGVKRGALMTDEEADVQSANPNYAQDYSYRINCQTCVPTYMLRKWGFDVTATPNTRGSVNEYISSGRSSKLWLNKDGTEVKYKSTFDWMMDNKVKRMTEKRYMQYFDEETREKGQYCLLLRWKGGGGHATILQRNEDGSLVRIEPQVYGGTVYRSVQELASHCGQQPYGNKGIFRMDDKIFDINGKTPSGKLFASLFTRR